MQGARRSTQHAARSGALSFDKHIIIITDDNPLISLTCDEYMKNKSAIIIESSRVNMHFAVGSQAKLRNGRTR
jgi:hypothetical protein